MLFRSQSTLPPPIADVCAVTRLDYLHAGTTGDAVVLLHGWGAFKELWWSTLRDLGPYFRAFAPDMPGHGQSPMLPDSSMAVIASHIAAFCQARGLDSIALVGHSMGGNVAAELALARPDLVRRLVLVDAATNSSSMPPYTRSYLLDTYGYAALRVTQMFGNSLRQLSDRVPHDHGGGTVFPALRRLAYAARTDAAALHSLLNQLMSNTLEDRLEQLRVPTLVISGTFDPLVPAALSRRIARSIPGAKYVEILGAGHNPMDERPREFSAALLQFLRSEV